MTTLYLGTPDKQALLGARSFENVMETSVGSTYALCKSDVRDLAKGDYVVVLRKDKNWSRAEGNLVKLEPTGIWTGNGLQRYNVHIEGLEPVPYDPGPRLKHTGVRVC